MEELPTADIIIEDYNPLESEVQDESSNQEELMPMTSPKSKTARLKFRSRPSDDHSRLYKRPALEKRRDSSEIFGEHIALKHRKYTDRTKCIVEHLISNILFKADMGEYENASTIEYDADIAL